ncbi:MAG: homocysteine S-methyltransferase family protein [Deltaproteobacteria bacterium]|nr:homocysteine S-methyltransferase family protein [Deltaproteobacteria bacterium]
MPDFLSELNKRQLVFDGAMGTMLQRLGLKPGGCPDELCIKDPELVKKVHRAYVEAGSDIVTTNTFGANRPKLKEYSLEGALRDINVAAARCAREAAGEKRFVAGGLGPTGRFVEPVGDMPFEETLAVFAEQAQALKEGGADLIIIETMMDIKEMKAAIMGAKTARLPVVATMTFDETMRTVLGTPPEAFAIMAAALGADCIGANCSLGIEGIYKAVLAMSKVVSIPLIAQPNAGLPMLKGTETVFPASPEEMAAFVPKLVEAGVRVLGGCCGTTPEHIRKMGDVFRGIQPAGKRPVGFTALASRTSFTLFGERLPAIVIGERINPTGRKAFAAEIKEGKTTGIRNEARLQETAGAHALDINVGVPGIDEVASMRRAVFAVNENSVLPAVIDSSNPEAVLAGLRAVDGRPLVNSISGEEKKLETILPLAKEYGAAVLGLALDDDGIPDTAEGRFKVVERMLGRVIKAGMRKEDLVVDCLAMTVSAAPLSAMETLKAIRMVKERLGLSTVLGVSNISFGLPAREIINSNFLTMAIEAGLDAAIINPNNKAMMDAYHASLVLLNRDLRAERYIKRHQALTEAAPAVAPKDASGSCAPAGIGERLKSAIINGDEENITALVEEALKEGWEPLKISNEALVPGLEEVGKLFASNRYYLPQVMLSAETMKKAFARLKAEMKGKKGKTLGKVLLATVEGDIHDIGKNIVATLLENHGFEVIDLGKNVSADRIVEEAEKNRVDIVGLSALMTTTVLEMDKVIQRLKDKGIKALTIVGGAVVTQEFSDKIGADQYGGDALSAIEKMKKMVRENA